jgi:ATP-dependent Clp protease ATP-binding subunit ClpC
MFERFTDRARRVVVLAQEEARMLNHNYIGTEHILLALAHEAEGIAGQVLTERGITVEKVRDRVGDLIGYGQQAPTGHIPFTPRAKLVLELSLKEARQLNVGYIATEHILLGLLREGDGVGFQIINALRVSPPDLRQAVLDRIADAHDAAAERGEPATTWESQLRQTERTKARLRTLTESPEHESLTPEYVIAETYVLAKIFNDHGIEPDVDLLFTLLKWKTGGTP